MPRSPCTGRRYHVFVARSRDTDTVGRFQSERPEYLLLQFAELSALLRDAVLDTLNESGTDSELISNASLRLLLRLDLEGPMRPRAIQDLTGLSSGGVTKLVDRLARADLVGRRHDVPDDARGIGVHITDEGRRLVATISAGLESWIPEVHRVVKDLERVLS